MTWRELQEEVNKVLTRADLDSPVVVETDTGYTEVAGVGYVFEIRCAQVLARLHEGGPLLILSEKR